MCPSILPVPVCYICSGCSTGMHCSAASSSAPSLPHAHKARAFPPCRCLFLADNHVAHFPDLSLMPHLHTLELARNHLTSLPPAHISSPALCCLDLSHNQLTTLSQLQHLPCLRELTVSDNQLTSLEGVQVCLLCTSDRLPGAALTVELHMLLPCSVLVGLSSC